MVDATIALSEGQAATVDAAAAAAGTDRAGILQASADEKIADVARDQQNARWAALTAEQKAVALTAGEAA